MIIKQCEDCGMLNCPDLVAYNEFVSYKHCYIINEDFNIVFKELYIAIRKSGVEIFLVDQSPIYDDGDVSFYSIIKVPKFDIRGVEYNKIYSKIKTILNFS